MHRRLPSVLFRVLHTDVTGLSCLNGKLQQITAACSNSCSDGVGASSITTSNLENHQPALPGLGHRGLHTSTASFSAQAAPQPQAPAEPSRQPGSTSSIPSTSSDAPTYTVKVLLTAFERRYLDAAANVIQDLYMVDFAPKAASTLSARRRNGSRPAAPFGITMGAAMWDVPVDWKRSRFTLIKGPHIDKFGMEQFEIRKYKKVLTASTTSSTEVHWLLEHLKLYEFPGVQLEVSVTGSTYLKPPAAAPVPPAAQPGGVLAQHRAAISRYLTPGAALTAAVSSASTSAQAAEVSSALDRLRGVVVGGLEARREAYKTQEWYQSWHHSNKSEALSSPAAAPRWGTAGTSTASVADLNDPNNKQAAALLEALDAAMLSLRFDALERHANFRYHFATAVPGSTPLPAAQWMHAVLKYGQYQQLLAKYSQEAQLVLAYTNYAVFAHTLLHTLLRVWMQTVVSTTKPYLALPKAEEAKGDGKAATEGGRKPLFA